MGQRALDNGIQWERQDEQTAAALEYIAKGTRCLGISQDDYTEYGYMVNVGAYRHHHFVAANGFRYCHEQAAKNLQGAAAKTFLAAADSRLKGIGSY